MGYNWRKHAAGVVPKQQCVGLHTVLLRRPEELSQVGFEAIRTVCMVSYVSPAAALLVEGASGLTTVQAEAAKAARALKKAEEAEAAKHASDDTSKAAGAGDQQSSASG